MVSIAPRVGRTVNHRVGRSPSADREHSPTRLYAGLGPGTLVLLQLTPGIDCMIALVVGLFGGMLAGMVLTQSREVDGSDPSSAPSQPRPMATTPIETAPSDGAFADDPALTDEERIVRLLASNSGRMKQSRIVEATDWSKAKVSRLLSGMEADDEITKLTVGRENIIFLGVVDEVYTPSDDSSD